MFENTRMNESVAAGQVKLRSDDCSCAGCRAKLQIFAAFISCFGVAVIELERQTRTGMCLSETDMC